MWPVIIHLVFLVGAVLLGLLERLGEGHCDPTRNESFEEPGVGCIAHLFARGKIMNSAPYLALRSFRVPLTGWSR
jgi:hypothetical protein